MNIYKIRDSFAGEMDVVGECICKQDGPGRLWDKDCPEHGEWIRRMRKDAEASEEADELNPRSRGSLK